MSKLTYSGLTSSPKDDFDEWYLDTHGTGTSWEHNDVDECEEDDYGDGETE